MAKVNFYHLTQSPMGKALPKLLEKVLNSGSRALVVAPNGARVSELNKELWTYTTKVFLPHGAKEDGYAADQPIYLTASNENANGADVLVMVEQAEAEIGNFPRCVYMFDGAVPAQVELARSRWKEYKAAGHEVVYWQQNAKGGWEQGAK